MSSSDARRVEVVSKRQLHSQPNVGEEPLSASDLLDTYAAWLGIRLQLIETRWYPIDRTVYQDLKRRQRSLEAELITVGIIRPKASVLP